MRCLFSGADEEKTVPVFEEIDFETNSFRIKEGGRDRERPCLITRKEKKGQIAC